MPPAYAGTVAAAVLAGMTPEANFLALIGTITEGQQKLDSAIQNQFQRTQDGQSDFLLDVAGREEQVAISWIVLSPCSASSATLALKSAVNRRRVVIAVFLLEGPEYTLNQCPISWDHLTPSTPTSVKMLQIDAKNPSLSRAVTARSQYPSFWLGMRYCWGLGRMTF